MRTFLLSIFWLANIGSVIQLLIIVSASWIVFSGTYSFSDLDVDTYITTYIPMFLWLKTLIISILGSFGYLILAIPILVIAPLKLVMGTIIGLWAYSAAKDMPVGDRA